MLKIIIVILIIYLVVKTGLNVRLPHPGMQAGVDVIRAANLTDKQVIGMAAEFIRYSDSQNRVAPASDPHAQRLRRLTDRYAAVNGVPLNFKVYLTSQINAFATADGSIRIFSGLMDVMTDDELMAIVAHEMGHVRNSDSLGTMRKAYLTSAARNLLGAAGGALGSLSASALGSLAEKLTTAQFSQAQESRADDFGFGFLLRNGYNPYAMADALGKISDISRRGGSQADQILQLFSTHPGSAERSARMRAMADAHVRKTAALPAQAGQSA